MTIDYDTNILTPFFGSMIASDPNYVDVSDFSPATVTGTITVATATTTIPNLAQNDDVVINGTTIAATNATPNLTNLAADINGAGVGVTAAAVQVSAGNWALRITSDDGSDMVIAAGSTGTLLTDVGITAGTFRASSTNARLNQPSEQRILTTIELLRSHIETLRSKREANLLHYVLGRVMAGIPENRMFDDIRVVVEGNVKNPTLPDGATFTITTESGTDTINIATDQGASLALLVAEINNDITNAAEVEAVATRDGRIRFQNTSGNEGVEFTIGGSGASLQRLGVAPGTYRNPVMEAADRARDDAVNFFYGEMRDVVL